MTVSYDFTGRTAVVTGGANGIGLAVAARLEAAGARVVSWDLQPCPLEGAESAIVDVADATSVADAVAGQRARGAVDILVHSAGWLGPSVATVDVDPAVWRRIIEINLIGTYEVCRHVAPLMRGREGASIVVMASIAGKEGTANASAYSASKAGVIGFVKAFAKEVVGEGIRVNCLAPGPIETGMLAQASARHVATMISKAPMGRLGTPEEAAELILWLASPAASYSTGAVYDLSGGRAVY